MFNLHIFPGEEILWRKDKTVGIFRVKVVESYLVTTHRVITMQKGRGMQQLMLQDVNKVMAMDMHSASKGDFQMIGLRNRTGFRYNVGSYGGKGRAVGNILFLSDTEPSMKWIDVADPRSVVALVKSLLRSVE